MKTKDKFDSAILGLNDLYIVTNENGNFFINSSKIIADDKTIKINSTYLLVDSSKGKSIKMYSVVLMDCSCQDNVIYLIVRDLQTQREFNVDYFIDDGEINGLSVLIDMDYLNELLDYKTIQSYCEKCPDSNRNSNTESKTKYRSDDLLEFEF